MIKRFLDYIDKLPNDKKSHWIIGSILCLSFFITTIFNWNHTYAYGFCFLIAAGNEVWQKVKKTGKFELKDIAYTMIIPTIFYAYTFL